MAKAVAGGEDLEEEAVEESELYLGRRVTSCFFFLRGGGSSPV